MGRNVELRGNVETRRAVLFVDDEPSITAMVSYALEASGYVVFTAHNGKDALQLYAAHHDHLDVVVVDYRLPDMSGNELVARIHDIDSRVPIVGMSGHGLGHIPAEMRNRITLFLPKPFGLASLADRLDEALALTATA